MTTVRVGIVSWNTRDLLDRCLEALPAALGDLDATVVVVDNASDDGSADVALRHSGVTLVRNRHNVGYARAMNEALTGSAAEQAEVLIALNPDTEPPPGSLATLVARLMQAPEVGLVAPKLCYADGRLQHSVYRFPSISLSLIVGFVPARALHGGLGERWWLEGFAPHDAPADIDWVIGAVHVIRRTALAGTPPYSERWFMYVEDLDLCDRLAARGWRRRLEADISVAHVGNAAGAQAWGHTRTARWLAATYDWYALRHGPFAMRLWAAVNLAGVVARILGSLVDPEHRANTRELRRVLPVHAGAFVGARRVTAPDLQTGPATVSGR